jgi:hypothetical protein
VYDISTSLSGEPAAVVAQLRSNFFGTQFHIIQRDSVTAACAHSFALPGDAPYAPPPPPPPHGCEGAHAAGGDAAAPLGSPRASSARESCGSDAPPLPPPLLLPPPALASPPASPRGLEALSLFDSRPPSPPRSPSPSAPSSPLPSPPSSPIAAASSQHHAPPAAPPAAPAPAGGSTVVGALSYDCNIWTQRGPRRMAVALSNPLLAPLAAARGEALPAQAAPPAAEGGEGGSGGGAAGAAAAAPAEGDAAAAAAGAAGAAAGAHADGDAPGGGEADAEGGAGALAPPATPHIDFALVRAPLHPPCPASACVCPQDLELTRCLPSLPPSLPPQLRNKAPRWHDAYQCWCLDFGGRVTQASVKNFQLVAQGSGRVLMQFGRTGHKDVFVMDYEHPLSAVQAFAVCLSAFDTKLACR